MLGTVTGTIHLSHMDLQFMAALTAGAARLCGYNVSRSSNYVAAYYLDAIEEYGGCPVDLVRDLGTKNGIMSAIHSFFRDDPDSHRYVPSPRNQQIEA